MSADFMNGNLRDFGRKAWTGLVDVSPYLLPFVMIAIRRWANNPFFREKLDHLALALNLAVKVGRYAGQVVEFIRTAIGGGQGPVLVPVEARQENVNDESRVQPEDVNERGHLQMNG